ncbi:HAD family hydrolase [Ruania zhangjianzhongii]|uniref:HAD family hydrolase n=1 Tax=Ruania zhangjianzhongii TaxID=2603206 RepID=UPI0011C9BCEF|nr:HAD family phosphatase [Ruania zhangjianzhongii]
MPHTSPTPLPGGALFDLDGTLIDSEPQWQIAQTRLAENAGVTWMEADFRATIGQPMPRWASILSDRGVPGTIEEIIGDAVEFVTEQIRTRMPWLPGARELLTSVAAAGVPCALVTNNAAASATLVAEAAGVFGAVVSSADVTDPKPHPEPYLRAADQLGVDPRRSIAFEDSTAGATSAHRAGMPVWFLAGHTSDPQVPVARRLTSLTEVSVDDVLAALLEDRSGTATAVPGDR